MTPAERVEYHRVADDIDRLAADLRAWTRARCRGRARPPRPVLLTDYDDGAWTDGVERDGVER